jgi:hypothetical protein
MPYGTKIQKNTKRVSNTKKNVATGVGRNLSRFEAYKLAGGKKSVLSNKSY